MTTTGRICVFLGSNRGVHESYAADAEALAAALAGRGLGLVYGGGNVGLMGVLADAMLQRGADVVGVIPHGLMVKEVGHEGLTELHVVDSMHERKALMVELSDGFVAMPGGLGTFEEFFEVLTWAQLGIHRKPVGLLNVRGYFDPLLTFLDHAVEEGFVKPRHRALLLDDTDPAALLDRLRAYEPPDVEAWLTRRET